MAVEGRQSASMVNHNVISIADWWMYDLHNGTFTKSNDGSNSWWFGAGYVNTGMSCLERFMIDAELKCHFAMDRPDGSAGAYIGYINLGTSRRR